MGDKMFGLGLFDEPKYGKVRTRFAPSPSGYLHLGGARTAIFNYVYAKQHGGEFVLRIDDTDEKRNMSSTVQPILDGLLWLGLDWDVGPIFQSERKQLYLERMYQLIRNGMAYPCYDGGSDGFSVYRGVLRNQSASITMEAVNTDKVSVRLRVPENQTIVLEDEIRGKIVWRTDDLGDPVIVRQDGSPTYNFATVVDDLDLNITHVIRGEEHLNNTPLQLAIYYGLLEKPPKFAHLPLVCEPNSKNKLSKRSGHELVTSEQRNKLKELGITEEDNVKYNPATISYYKELGYPPEAVVNYLSRLGWALDGTTEIFPMKDIIENFKLSSVKKKSASFDPKKFYWTAQEYLDKLKKEDLAGLCIPYLQKIGVLPEEIDIDTFDMLVKVVVMCESRIKIYSDIISQGDFFFRDPIYSDSTFKSYIKPMNEILKDYTERLKAVEVWNRANLEANFKNFISSKDIVNTNLNNAIRVAVSGKMVGPSVFMCMEILGRNKTIQRLERCINQPG
jgi:glutamyl-tRNA synthetase